MKKIYATFLALCFFNLANAQTWTKVSGIMDDSQVKGIAVINNQILVGGQNWGSNTLTDYALSSDGGNTWTKLPTYQFAGYLPNALPINNLMVCSNGFTASKKLVGSTWQSFSGAVNFAEFSNGSIIGSIGSYPDFIYNYSNSGVKGAKLGEYKFKLSAKFCNGTNNRLFLFAYGSGLAYIDYSNLGTINFPATLDGTAMTESSWQARYIIDMVQTSNGHLFACDYLNGGIIKSTDNGVNWTTLSTGYAGARITKNSSDEIFILAGNAEIRKSTDGGVTFKNISGNLPATYAFKVELFVNDDDELFCIINNGGGVNADHSGIFKLDYTTGFNDNIFDTQVVSIYPNPTNNLLQIDCKHDITNYEIVNAHGQTILFGKYDGMPIDISRLASGLYFINLTADTDMRIVKKIIKK
jgi:hypothetical protein